jgi:hypothetical protein
MKMDIKTNQEVKEIVINLYMTHKEEELLLTSLKKDLDMLKIEIEKRSTERKAIEKQWKELRKIENKTEQDEMTLKEVQEDYYKGDPFLSYSRKQFYAVNEEIISKTKYIDDLFLAKQHGLLLLKMMDDASSQNTDFNTFEDFYAMDNTSIAHTSQRLGYYKIELVRYGNKQPFNSPNPEIIFMNNDNVMYYYNGKSINLTINSLNKLYSLLVVLNFDFDKDFLIINDKYDNKKVPSHITDEIEHLIGYKLKIQLSDVNIDFKWDGELNNAPHRIKLILKSIFNLSK